MDSIDCFVLDPLRSKLIRKEMLFGDTIINSISYKKSIEAPRTHLVGMPQNILVPFGNKIKSVLPPKGRNPRKICFMISI
ncbi:MAG: hypothetical protein IPL95_20050 [Saprospiraceae bacterium]|nr:hypothetical protein [Saprospiraceae bacterium]